MNPSFHGQQSDAPMVGSVADGGHAFDGPQPLFASATQVPVEWIQPVWAEPMTGVGALMTTCQGGAPDPVYGGFNLGDHVGDSAQAVQARRAQLAQAIGAEPVWLRQIHGRRVVRLTRPVLQGDWAVDEGARAGEQPMSDEGLVWPGSTEVVEADGSWTTEPGLACVVMVADCLPVLLAGPQGQGVAALHAGWRGLCGAGPQMAGQGVVEAGLSALANGLACSPGQIQAWLGPCIGPTAFEVSSDVPEAFEPPDRQHFHPHPERPGKWLADLPSLARDRLLRLGVRRISGGHWCTVSDSERFYSFRRQPITGRQAALIWRR